MEQTTTIGLRYETTDDHLCFVLAELRELLHAHPKIRHTGDDPIRVRFVGFGDYARNVAIRAYANVVFVRVRPWRPGRRRGDWRSARAR
jgi:hypothetical protein